MSKSNLVAFRIPSELQDEFNRSVLASGGDKTSWLVDAIRMKLGYPMCMLSMLRARTCRKISGKGQIQNVVITTSTT
nr:hypothetical protein [Escherichia coli]